MAKYNHLVQNNSINFTRKIKRKDIINENDLRCLKECYIPGLFRPILIEKRKIMYAAPYATVLSKYLKNGVNVQGFYNILIQSLEILKRVSAYHLSGANIVLNTNAVFINEMSGELFFLYEPFEVKQKYINFVSYISQIKKEISVTEPKLKEEILLIDNYVHNFFHYGLEHIESFIKQRNPYTQQRSNAQELMETKGETVLLNADEDRTVLLSEHIRKAHLIRNKTGEKISIDQNDFYIGKSQDNNYCLMGNNAISRKHIVIYCKSGSFLIMDLDSTNHTYVNGNMLARNCTVPIKSGDVVKLADEEFIFEIT